MSERVIDRLGYAYCGGCADERGVTWERVSVWAFTSDDRCDGCGRLIGPRRDCVLACDLEPGMVVRTARGGAHVETVEYTDDDRCGPRVTVRDAAGRLVENYHPAEHVCLMEG